MGSTDNNPRPRKRVAIIGAGSAGMSAAQALSMSPDQFEVTLFERGPVCGGMATSTEIDPAQYGASYINDGVQGASPVFYNTFKMFEELGFGSGEVGMQCSFGNSKDQFWSNVFPSEVIDQYQADIKKFGKVLNIIALFEPVFALISVQTMLSMFRFSQGFGEVIVYPLVALFFGTGNQTPFISSAILERVFKDPSMRLFEYSPKSFLASIPEMRAFPRLSLLYSTWASVLESQGVKIRLRHEITAVDRTSDKKGVKVQYREVETVDLGQQVVGPKETQEDFWDEIILACDADAALKILGSNATWKEKKVLGNVKYLWDVTVTHSDIDYMKKYYSVEYNSDFASSQRADDKEAQDQFKFAEKNFRPLYYIRSYPENKKKIEMSFDLTHYQPQFKGESEYGPGGTGKPRLAKDRVSVDSNDTQVDLPKKPTSERQEDEATKVRKEDPESDYPPLKKHVFQTIFLDKEGSEDLWSRGEIKKETVILEKWWKQQSHRWQHYGGTVPWMMTLNGKHHTYYAGAWTILNMHEIGIVSGFAAAYRLGAKYPFTEDGNCKRLFALYLGGSHGCRMRKEDRDGFFA